MIRFAGEKGEERISGTVRELSFLGPIVRYVVEAEDGTFINVDEPNPKWFRPKGSRVYLEMDPEALHLQPLNPEPKDENEK